MTQTPMLPADPSTLSLSKETRRSHGFNGDQPTVSQDDSVNVRCSEEIEVRIGQSAVMESKLELEDRESITKEIQPTLQSTLDRGYAV
jgi:hypothetical protein